MIMHSTTDGRTCDKCIINLAYPDSGEMAVAVPTAFPLVNAEFSAMSCGSFPEFVHDNRQVIRRTDTLRLF
jgi:hypothetical protein